MREKSLFVKDVQDKESVKAPFLVKFSAVQVGKTGKPYMNVVLMDKTGELEARIWDDVTHYAGQVVRDAFVWVEGKCQLFQNRRQLVIQSVQILREDEVKPKDYIAESTLDPEELYEKLQNYIGTMQDPEYKALAEAIFNEDEEIQDRTKRAPAAKSMHHAYRTGLLEHMVSILGVMDGVARHYGGVLDRDLLFLGGLLHDIGKIWELEYDRVTDYSDEGRLIGHHVMGVELVERKIQALETQTGRLPNAKFTNEKKLLVKHVILAHHGRLEYGSPKEPQCLEAFVVHMIDDLDSKVGGISQFIAQDATPGKWTAINRQYERYLYKPEAMRK